MPLNTSQGRSNRKNKARTRISSLSYREHGRQKKETTSSRIFIETYNDAVEKVHEGLKGTRVRGPSTLSGYTIVAYSSI
jgi:hypothetical protein